MTRHSYRERNYAFGQVMLKLRSSNGLRQASLAALLGVSRRAVGEWEAGRNYPKAEHLQHLIGLCVQHVFTPGREEEEIRALWKAARQRVLWDGAWLHKLLSSAQPEAIVPASGATDDSGSDSLHRIGPHRFSANAVFPAHRLDWGARCD